MHLCHRTQLFSLPHLTSLLPNTISKDFAQQHYLFMLIFLLLLSIAVAIVVATVVIAIVVAAEDFILKIMDLGSTYQKIYFLDHHCY